MINRINLDTLPADAREALFNLKRELSKALPKAVHAQVTFDNLHEEHAETIDIRTLDG
jgi:hypothetical protein